MRRTGLRKDAKNAQSLVHPQIGALTPRAIDAQQIALGALEQDDLVRLHGR